MPTYEYECESCGHRFEARQAMGAAPLGECPACGGAVRRLPSAPGVLLKRPGAGGASGCAFEARGRTCCGRDTRCDTRPCEG
jgi:putative FmdB family regulatory protein